MRNLSRVIILWFFLATPKIGWTQGDGPKEYSYTHPIPFQPNTYVSYFTETPITIDGVIDKEEWEKIAWTDKFVDIEGQNKPNPFLDCRAKITWDNEYLYFAAHLEEPHIWATLTEHDAIMFHDDDFEVFIDPDGDGHQYFELEMNAFNSIWDLYMLYPYYMDDRRNYIMNWNIKGLKSAVHIEGSLNDGSDEDEYWSLELAIPWSTFKDFKKGEGKPEVGDQWRMNFSRVDWPVKAINGKYEKLKDDNEKNLPERNWVWSPTGYINMHKPETWGYIQFEKDHNVAFQKYPDEDFKWDLWQIFYKVKECWKSEGQNCALNQMDIPNHMSISDINLSINSEGFFISISSKNGNIYTLNHLGRLTSTVQKAIRK